MKGVFYLDAILEHLKILNAPVISRLNPGLTKAGIEVTFRKLQIDYSGNLLDFIIVRIKPG